MVDRPALPFGEPGEPQLPDDRGRVRRLRLHRPGQGPAAEGAEPHHPGLDPLALPEGHAVVHLHDEEAAAFDHRARGREVERDDRDPFLVDVAPDVQLGPVRQREYADRLAPGDPGVVEPPELGALAAGVPAMGGGAEREDPLLGARGVLVAPRPAERGVEAEFVERLAERLGLHDVGVEGRAVAERPDPPLHALPVDVNQQLHPVRLGHAVPELVHLRELPGRVDVEQRKRRRRRVERLAREVQQDRGILPDRVEHHRSAKLGHRFAQDVDRLRFEPAKVGQGRGGGQRRCFSRPVRCP